MFKKMPGGGRLTEYALLLFVLVGVAIMNIAVFKDWSSEKLLGVSSAVSEAE